MIDLNTKSKTVKILEDDIRENLGGLGFSDDFLYTNKNHDVRKKKMISSTSLKLHAFAL